MITSLALREVLSFRAAQKHSCEPVPGNHAVPPEKSFPMNSVYFAFHYVIVLTVMLPALDTVFTVYASVFHYSVSWRWVRSLVRT